MSIEPEPPPREFQFSLWALFAFTAGCGVYFLAERLVEGQFAVHVLAATALALGVALPLFWFAAWISRMLLDGGGSLGTLLLIGTLGGAIALLLARSFGL